MIAAAIVVFPIVAAAAEEQNDDQNDPAAVAATPTVTKAHMFHLVSFLHLRYTMEWDRNWCVP